jgi:hypothetical protein
MKACDQCTAAGRHEDRVRVSSTYKEKPLAYKLVCVLLIYLPLLSIPFVIFSGVLIARYLKIAGARDFMSYRSFLPDRQSHRYDLKSQVTMESDYRLNPIRTKLFWIWNCTWYCPYSVALFEWHAYLMKLMETLKNCNKKVTESDWDADMEADDSQKRKSLAHEIGNGFLSLLLLLFLPFVIFSAMMTVMHLKMAGATNMRVYRSFLPDGNSFPYELKNPVTMVPGAWFSRIANTTFWVAKYSRFLGYSTALFDWHAYLVKLVENWWCPFHHNRKDPHYRVGAINQSFWHLYPEDLMKLAPDDRDNPIWNEFKQ